MAVYSGDLDFQDAARYVQQGSWKEATKVLERMLMENPEQRASILPLLEDVRMKAKIRTRGTKGRSYLSLLVTRKRIGYALIVLLVILLGIGASSVYNRLVVPARQEQAQRAQIDALFEQARAALAASNYLLAENTFAQVLEKEPASVEADKGYTEAKRQLELSTSYDRALSQLSQGQVAAALETFTAIQSLSPGYRDVQKQIDQIQNQSDLNTLFAQAGADFQAQNWLEAAALYQKIRQRNQDYQTAIVEQHLYESYINLAEARINLSGLSNAEVDEVAQLYRMAVSLRPKDRESRLQEQRLNQYRQAVMLIDADRFSQAIALLGELYQVDPDLLGGDHIQQLFVARMGNRFSQAIALLDELYQVDPGLLGGDHIQQLYVARMGYGWELEQSGSYLAALAQYSAAQELPVADVSEAVLRFLSISLALTPAPTPTPEPTPMPTPDPLKAYLDTLPPQASPIENYPGWIAFRSDRPNGSRYGLWVMSPDGSQQLPVDDPKGRYESSKQQALWTNDNMRRIWVEDDGSGVSVAIYMWRYDIPANWLDARVELLNNSAINYLPALSPDNSAIVFTSQRNDGPLGANYGDEIFIIYFSEFNDYGHVTAHRLTKNDWEWDKHPTFSPDGKTIAFWSNRETGRAQIWAMQTDGSNQRNLSNNEWNDWDPVYIVPLREIPKLEKDGRLSPLFDPDKFQGNR